LNNPGERERGREKGREEEGRKDISFYH